MIGRKHTDTTNPSPSNTPNTRKRSRNYAILNAYGLEGSPEPTLASLTPSSWKKAPKKHQNNLWLHKVPKHPS